VISIGILIPLVAAAQNYEFSTIAGLAGSIGGQSNDGTNSAARFDAPSSIVVVPGTNLYVSDYYNQIIRKVSPIGTNWVVTTIAGTAHAFGEADGTNGAARFDSPTGIAIDNQGALYVADYGNHIIRKVTPAGTNWIVTTIAGLADNLGSNDGTNSDARFRFPRGLSVDSDGNVFVADTSNSTIRKISPFGTNWIVTTIAGLALNQGSLDGTNSSARFKSPSGTAVDNSGNVYVTDYFNNAIRKMTADGTNWVVSTLAGVLGESGTADGTNGAARFTFPAGIATTTGGDIFVTDFGAHSIRRLVSFGTNWAVATIGGQAGTPGSLDGINTNAQFRQPSGVGTDSAGNIFIADTGNNTIRFGKRVEFVVSVPPDFLSVIKSNTSIVFTWSAVIGRSYQVQYKTNLLQPSWINLGADGVATNSIMSGSDLMGSNLQRFYRISLLP
jgi:sugar lactone lactonase YvrE